MPRGINCRFAGKERMMGTNFYFEDRKIHRQHIGKRSAAGMFCWDCGVSLCASGSSGVHSDKRWLEECPKCGQKPTEEDLGLSSAGRELGFNKTKPKAKNGVKSCSSFSWAISPVDFKKLRGGHIRDEYDRKVKDFAAVLSECPIQRFDMIGKEFS